MKKSLLGQGEALVPHTRVELVIFCVRGRCPGPLDECGIGDNFTFEIGCKGTNILQHGKIFFIKKLQHIGFEHYIFPTTWPSTASKRPLPHPVQAKFPFRPASMGRTRPARVVVWCGLLHAAAGF